MPLNIILLLLITACSSLEAPPKPLAAKEFAHGEIILSTQLLTKIFDQEMAPIKCVPDLDEASLLLRTIHPRMEVVQDDLEAMLDNESEIQNLIEKCDQSCTCPFLDELFREHLVVLNKKMRNMLDTKKKEKDLNSCLNYSQQTFCSSEIYKALNQEKADFSFDEETE
jgi:hypothetical protein